MKEPSEGGMVRIVVPALQMSMARVGHLPDVEPGSEPGRFGCRTLLLNLTRLCFPRLGHKQCFPTLAGPLELGDFLL